MKLEYRNDWESDIYSVGGKRVKTLDEVSINGILFPVKGRRVCVPCYDMGHVYDVCSMHFFITVPISGINMVSELELKKVIATTPLLEVIPTKYTTSD